MGAKKDLTGMIFGKLTVIREVPKNERPNPTKVFWNCKCDCGNETIVLSSNLTNGHTTSCGCKRAEAMAKTMTKNIAGNKYGKLLVLEKTNSRSSDGCVMWKCQCDCGNITYVNSNSLKRGDISSCGCLRSKGEQKINQLLFDNKVSYRTQFHFPDLKDKKYLYFDFAIYNNDNTLKCLVEYQGIQHYDEKVLHGAWKNSPRAHDKMKKQYCKEHNILLIEIPYFDFDKITWEYLENKLNL